MPDTIYNSTRGGEIGVSASTAIIKGLANDGGLFVPKRIPKLDLSIETLCEMDYRNIAYEVMKLYFSVNGTKRKRPYWLHSCYLCHLLISIKFMYAIV